MERKTLQFSCLLVIFGAALLVLASQPLGSQASPVSQAHLQTIQRLFVQHGISQGRVELDRFGRVILKGEYLDERQVDLGFSLAQQVVGPRWVSPVTPENIKVEEWQKRLGGLFVEAGRQIRRPSEVLPSAATSGPIREKYALVMGVGHFRNPKISPLEFAANDAKAFAKFLIDEARFPAQNVYLFTEQEATREKVKRAMDQIKAKAGPDDLVVVFMSSHGTPPDKFGGVHVVTYDAVVEPRHKVWETAISDEMIKDFVQSVRSQRFIMITDACYSNGAYKNIPGFLPSGGKSLGVGDDEAYSMSKEYGARLLGAKDLIVADTARPSLRDTRGPAFGKVLISASGPNEKSWEDRSIRHGYFTYYFLDGLKRHGTAVQDAFFYAKPLVMQRVRKDKEGASQTPQALATSANWNIPLTAAAR